MEEWAQKALNLDNGATARCVSPIAVRRLVAILFGVTVVAALIATATGVAATTDPYPSGQTGYDISYPQCGAAAPLGSFGIVGVNGGRPFSYNACLSVEYAAAPKTIAPSLYINTAYSGAYRKNISSTCANLSASIAGTSAQRQAWAIGCSEAETSVNYSVQQGVDAVAMWWLDVETGTSWSSSNLSLNQYAIQGATSRLLQTGAPVGVYSSASMWTTITGGGFTPTGISADWEASGGSCNSPFTNSPVWLLQSTSSGFDSDFAC